MALASSTVTLPACSWDRPGVNPFMGDVVAAVDRYKDIPAAVRESLKARMEKREYDEIVSIRKDAISGKGRYGAEIREMHFGAGSICTTVSRARWTQEAEQKGLVYCQDNHCILVPTVCRNVSRIKRLAKPTAIAPATAQQMARSEQLAEDPPLEFEAPAAGPAAPTAATPTAASPSFSQIAAAPAGGGFGGGAPLFSGGGTPPSGGGAAPPPLPPGVVTNEKPPIVVPPINPPVPPVTPPIPEPGTWAMMLLGLAGLAAWQRRRSA